MSMATSTIGAPDRAIVISPRVRSCSVRRYYDPGTGQFLTVDPLVDETDQPYGYAGDDPIDSVDPLGLYWGESLVHKAEHATSTAWGAVNPVSTSNLFYRAAASGSPWAELLKLNPAYLAVSGYANEAQAYENGCSLWTVAKYGAEGAGGLALTGLTAAGGAALFAGDAAAEAPGFAEGSIGHIFRDAPGHLAQDTAENRALIQSAVKSGNYVRTGGGGEDLYRETLPDGTQVWAKVFNGQITNGGVNQTPIP